MTIERLHAQNVVLISLASVLDPSLAPAGKHTLHAYLPATEPFHLWEGKSLLPRALSHLEGGLQAISPSVRGWWQLRCLFVSIYTP